MEDEVGDERLLERGGEALDQLVRQAADEADRVGDEIAAAVVLEAARGRVERLEQAVVDRDAGARERVQERRLADVRVPGERDRRDLVSLARLSSSLRAACSSSSSRRFSSVTRRRASRRSVSSCVSPGPRVPTPPPTAVAVPPPGARGAARGRACAGGCTRAARARPGACPRRCARAGRRCRGSAGVRSTTRAFNAFSRFRCCGGLSSSSTSSDSASAPP